MFRVPELTLTFFAIAALAVVFAGVSKAGFGSGAAFASASILALIAEPGAALAFMLPLLMLVDAASLRPYWGRWDLRGSGLLIAGALPGVFLGVLFFRAVDADGMRLMIGGISLGFVGWQMSARLSARLAGKGIPAWGGVLAGAAAGFASFVSHAGGPAAAVYLLGRGMGKTEYQATTVLVFGAVNIAKAVPYAGLGLLTVETLAAALLFVPFALAGTWAGVRLHYLIPERAFFAVTYVLLTLTGAKLIWDGLG